jgi:hypothetical protein
MLETAANAERLQLINCTGIDFPTTESTMKLLILKIFPVREVFRVHIDTSRSV